MKYCLFCYGVFINSQITILLWAEIIKNKKTIKFKNHLHFDEQLKIWHHLLTESEVSSYSYKANSSKRIVWDFLHTSYTMRTTCIWNLNIPQLLAMSNLYSYIIIIIIMGKRWVGVLCKVKDMRDMNMTCSPVSSVFHAHFNPCSISSHFSASTLSQSTLRHKIRPKIKILDQARLSDFLNNNIKWSN